MIARIVLVAVAAAVLLAVTAWAQEVDGLLGHHPQLRGEHHDPYHHAQSVSGFPCCHGNDCMEFFGEVEKVPGGYRFGPWFVPDGRFIRVETLARRVRGKFAICFQGGRASAVRLGPGATVYCGYAPESGV